MWMSCCYNLQHNRHQNKPEFDTPAVHSDIYRIVRTMLACIGGHKMRCGHLSTQVCQPFIFKNSKIVYREYTLIHTLASIPYIILLNSSFLYLSWSPSHHWCHNVSVRPQPLSGDDVVVLLAACSRQEMMTSSLSCPMLLARLQHHHLMKVRDELKPHDISGEKKTKKIQERTIQ